MKSTSVAYAAVVGVAAAQSYTSPAAYTPPTTTVTSAAQTFACNPAHSYPNGASCISTAGSLTLVTPTTTAQTFACNPAHSYPAGVSCISTDGSLTLVYPSTTTAQTFACNPAHSYPAGVSCISTDGSLTLVYPTATASTTATSCDTAYDQCRIQPNANMAYCASQYAACLGYNPFTQPAITTTPVPTTPAMPTWSSTTVTKIISSYTTVCPSSKGASASTGTKSSGSQGAPAGSSSSSSFATGAIVPTGSSSSVATGATRSSGSATTSPSVVPYTGAADQITVGGSFMMAALAAFAML